ncbi:PIN domain-containing protein [Nitrospiraceae bacterium AH_259_D15_M11_P09]|nr:PIN domain-containing protein [Nitrospiraceae bacterium AH_259_D15_M11_P09]
MNAILVDAGPLVAVLHRDDQHHQLCVDTLARLTDPLVSAWPVLTEAMYLLSFSWQAQDALWELLVEGIVRLLPLESDDYDRMRELMKKYRSLPMDLADAALVTVAERERLRRVFTLDRRDFSIYRPTRIGKFALIP